MVSVVISDALRDASSLQLAVGAFAATLIAYKLLFPPLAPHEAYAKKHRLTNIKLAKRLPKSQFLWGDAVELSRNVSRIFDWILDRTLEMNEQPWLRHVPSTPDSIMVATPALIEDIIKTQTDVFAKGESTRAIFSGIIDRGFLVLDGHEWFHQRKIATKFFSTRMLRDVATMLFNKHIKEADRVLDISCGSDEPVNLSKLCHDLTKQFITELAFGLEMDLVGSNQRHPFHDATEEILPVMFYRAQMPPWLWELQRFLNIGSERKCRQLMGEIRCIVGEMVQKCLVHAQSKGPRGQPTNIVESYIADLQDEPTDSNAPEISPETLRDIAIISRAKLRKELWVKVPELMRGEVKTLTMDQTKLLPYLDAVIKETLRLYAPGPLIIRQPERDTHLVDGTFVPKEATVTMMPYVMGRLHSIWGDDALDFKPERFIDAATGQPRVVSPFELFGFGAGPRVCIAKQLAMLEMKLLVATLLSRFHLDVLPNDGSYKIAVTMALENPLLARIRRAT